MDISVRATLLLHATNQWTSDLEKPVCHVHQKPPHNHVTVRKHTSCPLITLGSIDDLAQLAHTALAGAESPTRFRSVHATWQLLIAPHASCHPVCMPLLDLLPPICHLVIVGSF